MMMISAFVNELNRAKTVQARLLQAAVLDLTQLWDYLGAKPEGLDEGPF